MKGVVAFDSVFGNTRQVAEAIKDELEKAGHDVVLLNLRESGDVPAEGDFILVGSPTRMGTMTRKSKRLVKKLDVRVWGSKPLAVFDTHAVISEDPEERAKSIRWVEPGAAGKLAKLASGRGLQVSGPPLRCSVTGSEGPLAEGQLEKAREYARGFAGSLGK
jgi:flavodoxin